MLHRGYKPENFDAWMWSVARAKYASWAKNKKFLSQNVISGDISDNIHIASGEEVESEVIKKEEIHLLRRELSIMSREYREITVAYYIENKKISDISKAVGLPEGTVKRKLSESRKYLKEGMKMTRTYGKRSYSPETVNFRADRTNTEDNMPYSLMESKLAKNILLEAYANPCSTEELSVSLGVASPYLEEELDKLAAGLLLAKTKDNKYETDFVILDKQTQKAIFDKTLETADKICDTLMFFAGCNANFPYILETADILSLKERQSMLAAKYISQFAEGYRLDYSDAQRAMIQEIFKNIIEKWKTDFGNYSTEGAVSPDLSLWFHVFKTIRDIILTTGMAKGISDEYTKKYKGEWTITGFEDYSDHEILKHSVGLDWDHNAADKDADNQLHLFKFYFDHLGLSRERPRLKDIELFADILKHGRTFGDLSESEKNTVNGLAKKELAAVENDTVKPAFPIIFTAGLDQLDSRFMDADFPEDLKAIMKSALSASAEIVRACTEEIFKLYEYNLAQIKEGLPERLNEQARFCARDMLHYLHSAVLKYATERRYIPETDKPVGIGAYVARLR